MATVYKRYDDEPVEKMLRRFKKLIESEQILSTFMRKRYYMKPSEIRKYKKHRSEMRRKKMMYKMKKNK